MSDVQSAVLKLKHEKLDRSVWVPNVISLMEAVAAVRITDDLHFCNVPQIVEANERLAKTILAEGKGRLVTEKEFRNEALGVRDGS